MARPKPLPVAVRVRATDPPPNPPGDVDLAWGIQRGKEVEQLTVSGSTGASIEFQMEIGLVSVDGDIDFRGPYVHGRKGDRFLYVVWGALKPTDEFERFARAKLILNDIPSELLPTPTEVAGAEASAGADGELDEHHESGSAIVCDMQATNQKGQPASGTLRAPAVSWS